MCLHGLTYEVTCVPLFANNSTHFLTLKYFQWCCRLLYSEFKSPVKRLAFTNPLKVAYECLRDSRKAQCCPSSPHNTSNTQTRQVRIWNMRWQAAILAPQGSKNAALAGAKLKTTPKTALRCTCGGARLLEVAHPEDPGSQAGSWEGSNLLANKKHQGQCCVIKELSPPWKVKSPQQLLPQTQRTAHPLPHQLLLLQLFWLHCSPLTNLHL